MLSRIRAFVFVIEFAITIAIVIFLMFLFNKQNRKIRQIWAKIQKFFIGYKLNILGNQDETANLLIINHQSLVDIILIEDIHHSNIAWCAKKELFSNPFTRFALSLPKMIEVDRNDKRAIVKLINDAKDRLKHERVIAIFPEGTRGNGDRLLKFQMGAKILAQKLNLKVQPIVINGTQNVFDMKKFKITPGKIDISFMSIVDINDSNWYENLHISMQKELSNLRQKN